MNILDNVADTLVREGRGFFLVQYDSKDGKGVQYRWKADDMEMMLGFLIPIVDSICNEYVENEGYLVHESIRQTVEKTMAMNDTRPSEELFNKSIARLQEIFSKYYKPKEDDNSEETEEADQYRNKYEELSHALRCCADMNCAKCPRLPKTDENDHYDTLCQQALLSEASEVFDELSEE